MQKDRTITKVCYFIYLHTLDPVWTSTILNILYSINSIISYLLIYLNIYLYELLNTAFQYTQAVCISTMVGYLKKTNTTISEIL